MLRGRIGLPAVLYSACAPPVICHRERRRPSEVARIGRVIAIPVFHASIFGFYKTQTAPMGTVPHRKTPRLDGIARFEIVGRDANPLKCRTANGLHNPYLRIARCVLNLNVDPRVRYDKMHFLHYALNVRISVGVVAGRMVRRCRDGEHQRRNCHKAENRFERHAHLSFRSWKMDKSPFLPSRSWARRVNPIATLKIAVDARRRRKSVDVDLLIAKPNSSFVEKSEGL